MPTPKSSKSAAAKTAAGPASVVHNGRARAPFGFIFFFLLLTATFVFSTFFVISQTARDENLRQEAWQANIALEQRLDALQSQVNTLSARVALQQEQPRIAVPTSTTSTLPSARTR